MVAGQHRRLFDAPPLLREVIMGLGDPPPPDIGHRRGVEFAAEDGVDVLGGDAEFPGEALARNVGEQVFFDVFQHLLGAAAAQDDAAVLPVFGQPEPQLLDGQRQQLPGVPAGIAVEEFRRLGEEERDIPVVEDRGNHHRHGFRPVIAVQKMLSRQQLQVDAADQPLLAGVVELPEHVPDSGHDAEDVALSGHIFPALLVEAEKSAADIDQLEIGNDPRPPAVAVRLRTEIIAHRHRWSDLSGRQNQARLFMIVHHIAFDCIALLDKIG